MRPGKRNKQEIARRLDAFEHVLVDLQYVTTGAQSQAEGTR
jgi:hypothetical protein